MRTEDTPAVSGNIDLDNFGSYYTGTSATQISGSNGPTGSASTGTSQPLTLIQPAQQVPNAVPQATPQQVPQQVPQAIAQGIPTPQPQPIAQATPQPQRAVLPPNTQAPIVTGVQAPAQATHFIVTIPDAVTNKWHLVRDFGASFFTAEVVEPGIQNTRVELYRSDDAEELLYKDVIPMDKTGFQLTVMGTRPPDYAR